MRHVAGSLLDYAQSGVLRSCVLAGCRCDGRGLSDGRQINIQFSGAERGRVSAVAFNVLVFLIFTFVFVCAHALFKVMFKHTLLYGFALGKSLKF